MAIYLANQIEQNKLNYKIITESAKYSQFKTEIDRILIEDGYTINTDGTVTRM